MRDVGSVCNQWQQARREFREFDWIQLLRPANVGRWPTLPRAFVLVMCTLLIMMLFLMVSRLLVSGVRDEEYGVLNNLQESIHHHQMNNIFIASQQLDVERRSFVAYALLQQDWSAVADITKIMDVIRSAAVATGVQLLSVIPEGLADKDRANLTVQARLELTSLSIFWRLLSEAPINFSVDAIALEWTGKGDIFELSLGLAVQVAADIGPPAQWTEPRAGPDVKTAVEHHTKARHKGFLVRSGSSQFLYLVRDEKGRLKRVE